ncbi:ATP-binding protein [Rhodococcus sp. IEGM 1366]|nr:ATP-binding protein [Rhodococcus sp. IEGM 1366]MDV8070594.1 ATP-binding protein [Rhodococcus sp. IEGM 1366]
MLRESLSNAIKHADAFSVTITVDVQDELTISVADNGVGIAHVPTGED